jgi:hypothetical protein
MSGLHANCNCRVDLAYPRPKPPTGGVKANYPGLIAPALATTIGKDIREDL